MGSFKTRVKKEYWGRRHSAGSDESGEELHKAISLCLEWIDNNESTDVLTSSAKKKKIDATEKAILLPEAPLGNNNNAPIRSSVQSKNVNARLVKHCFSKEELMEHGDVTALASGSSDFSVTQISAKMKKGGDQPNGGRRSFLENTVEGLGLCSKSMKQDDNNFGQLVDLLRNNNNTAEQQKQEKVVICLKRAGSDKNLEMVFQKSSDMKMENIIQEASMRQCDFFNFTALEHEAVRSKSGCMMLNVDGMSDFSYGLFKSFGLIELVDIAKGEKNMDGHTVINITSRIEMKGQDVSHLLA